MGHLSPYKLRIKTVQEYKEEDKDQGVDRIYMYYRNCSRHIETDKQRVDILDTPQWGKMLFMDGVLQSSTKDEIIYHSALVHPLMECLDKHDQVLILGGGEGATAREVLKYDLSTVVMVDYDKTFVEFMKTHGDDWSKGAFHDTRLGIVYQDAWEYMKMGFKYDAVIIDLTDPDLKKEMWANLLARVMNTVKIRKGGFVMNAGLYLPWNTSDIKNLVDIIRDLCEKNPEFKYYVYTAFIPSFSGEWTFIAVSHKCKFMMDPEFLTTIPEWIRRSIRMLPDSLIYSNLVI